jgi:hypothetical protein
MHFRVMSMYLPGPMKEKIAGKLNINFDASYSWLDRTKNGSELTT